MTFPTIDACIVCEGVRQEVLGKYILLGFFGITPHAQVSLKYLEQPSSLCFVFCGGGGAGRFNVGLRVTDIQGIPVSNTMPGIMNGELIGGKPATSIFLGFQGIFGRIGKYRVTLIVDDSEHYSTSINVEQAIGI
jgi:hypothetical protein